MDTVSLDSKEEEEEELAGGEEYTYCEQCGGYIPVSSGPHPHN
jgi:hypothetical protein